MKGLVVVRHAKKQLVHVLGEFWGEQKVTRWDLP
jgi:hypothetical protein